MQLGCYKEKDQAISFPKLQILKEPESINSGLSFCNKKFRGFLLTTIRKFEAGTMYSGEPASFQSLSAPEAGPNR